MASASKKSADDEFRALVGKVRNGRKASLREARQRLRRASRKNINAFFTSIARNLPEAVKTQIGLVIQGFAKKAELRYQAEGMFDLTGLETMDVRSFAGFKKLDAATKKLNIGFNTFAGRDIHTRNTFLHVNIDPAEPRRKGPAFVSAYFGPL